MQDVIDFTPRFSRRIPSISEEERGRIIGRRLPHFRTTKRFHLYYTRERGVRVCVYTFIELVGILLRMREKVFQIMAQGFPRLSLRWE